MALDPTLLEIVVCPGDKAELTYDESAQTLTCVDCGRVYEIRDGVPVLLLEEAREPGASPAGPAAPQR